MRLRRKLMKLLKSALPDRAEVEHQLKEAIAIADETVEKYKLHVMVENADGWRVVGKNNEIWATNSTSHHQRILKLGRIAIPNPQGNIFFSHTDIRRYAGLLSSAVFGYISVSEGKAQPGEKGIPLCPSIVIVRYDYYLSHVLIADRWSAFASVIFVDLADVAQPHNIALNPDSGAIEFGPEIITPHGDIKITLETVSINPQMSMEEYVALKERLAGKVDEAEEVEERYKRAVEFYEELKKRF